MKKILSVLLCTVLIFSALPLTLSASAEAFGDYEYNILSDGTAEITKYKGRAETLTIPSSIYGYTVTSIGDYAFSGCRSLTSITIPNSITSIGDGAFRNCRSLTSITIPNSVTSISWDAFYYCTSLKSVTIPNSVTSIGRSAFGDCTSLKSVTIPNSVTSIGSGAFSACTSLTSITIPNSVTSIGSGAFGDCTSLTKINVDSENNCYSSENGVLFNKDKTELIQYPAGKTATEYSIPNSVTSIGYGAFDDCTSLKSITIPNSVTSIGGSSVRELHIAQIDNDSEQRHKHRCLCILLLYITHIGNDIKQR